uniref:Uncharacterized protein n=1 Tax=Xenopus tropicalis TaxID=8364 RepID=A0A6I8SQ33_XENTR
LPLEAHTKPAGHPGTIWYWSDRKTNPACYTSAQFSARYWLDRPICRPHTQARSQRTKSAAFICLCLAIRPVPRVWPTRPVPRVWPTRPVPRVWPTRPVPRVWPTRPVPRVWPTRPVPRVWPTRPVPRVWPTRPVPRVWPTRPVPRVWPTRPVPRVWPIRPVPRVWPIRPVPRVWPIRSDMLRFLKDLFIIAGSSLSGNDCLKV